MPTDIDEAMRLVVYWISEHQKVQKLAREQRDELVNLRNRLNSGATILGSTEARMEDLLEEIHRQRIRIEQLEEVCRFYANDENWEGAPACIVDNGQKAQNVLEAAQ